MKREPEKVLFESAVIDALEMSLTVQVTVGKQLVVEVKNGRVRVLERSHVVNDVKHRRK